MVKIPVGIRNKIDPKLTFGLGALNEDETKGLQCPVRGCGEWHHSLSNHVSIKHKDIGGARGLRKLLQIPSTAALCTETYSRARATPLSRSPKTPLPKHRSSESEAKRLATLARNSKTAGWDNLKDGCLAQTGQKLALLKAELGRVPSSGEFRARYGSRLEYYVMKHFGTWNNALTSMGWVTRPARRYTRADVVTALGAFYARWGRLPTRQEADAPVVPLVPTYQAIRNAFNGAGWPTVMRQVCALLEIYDGKYGLPIENKPVERIA